MSQEEANEEGTEAAKPYKHGADIRAVQQSSKTRVTVCSEGCRAAPAAVPRGGAVLRGRSHRSRGGSAPALPSLRRPGPLSPAAAAALSPRAAAKNTLRAAPRLGFPHLSLPLPLPPSAARLTCRRPPGS